MAAYENYKNMFGRILLRVSTQLGVGNREEGSTAGSEPKSDERKRVPPGPYAGALTEHHRLSRISCRAWLDSSAQNEKMSSAAG